MIDLTGKKFGLLRVIERDKGSTGVYPKWICECRCGSTVSVRGDSLRYGKKRKCSRECPGYKMVYRVGEYGKEEKNAYTARLSTRMY